VRAVEFAFDDVVEQDHPVLLGGEFDGQAFGVKKAFFLGDHERGAVGEFDETEVEVLLFDVE